MDDPRTDAPELDLTSIADEDGDDALQATLYDSVAGQVILDGFAIDSSPANSAAPKQTAPAATAAPAESQKPHRANVQLGDDRFVAALLGLPMENSKNAKKAKNTSPAAQTAPPAGAKSQLKSPAPAHAVVLKVEAGSAAAKFAPVRAAAEGQTDVVRQPSRAVDQVPTAPANVAPQAPAPAPPAPAIDAKQISRPERRSVPRPPAGPMAATAPVTVHEPEIRPEIFTKSPIAVSIGTNHVEQKNDVNLPLPAQQKSALCVTAENHFVDAEPFSPPVAAVSSTAAVAMKSPATAASPIAPAIPAVSSAQTLITPTRTAAVSVNAAKVAPTVLASVVMTASPRAVPIKANAPLVSANPVVSIASPSAAVTPVSDQPRAATGAWWTLPLMFIGLIMIACALIVPVADENHRAAYELAKIERDVAHFQSQSDVNQSFLARVSTDPALSERLAMRQLNMIRPDEHFAALKGRHDAFSMSPFALVSVDPPAPMPAYHPIGGFLSRWFLSPRFQIYFVGLGLLLTAAGVVFGGGGKAEVLQESPRV